MSFRRLGIFLTLLLSGFYIMRAVEPPVDLIAAMDLCDNADLRPVEGLWQYPEDQVTVLIFRESGIEGKYGMWVVESADCSLEAGKKIGGLTESPDPRKFDFSIFTAVRKGVLQLPCQATATLSTDNESIIVTKPSIKISFRPNRLLPGFWKTVSVGIKDPSKAPRGMIRVYPSYDGNNSRRRDPRYL